MKTKIKPILYLTFIIPLLVNCSNTKPMQEDKDLKTEIKGKEYTGLIVAYPFVNKIGEEMPQYHEHYFLSNIGEYFIKKSESHYQADLKEMINCYVRVDASINDGLWDTNDPNVQSRVGPYITIESIELIDIPVKIIYNDGSSNAYIITPTNYKYDPVIPEESSSGVYSGGEARDFEISQEQFNEIFIRAEGISKNKTLQIESRMMGTGYIRLIFENSEISIYIADCKELKEFENYLKNVNPNKQ